MINRTIAMLSPPRELRAFGYAGALLLGIVWTLVGTLAYARHYLQNPGRALDASVLPEYLIWLTCFLPWVALTPMVFRAERRFSPGQAGWLRNLAALAAIGVPVACAATALGVVLARCVQILFRLPPDPGHGSELLPIGSFVIQQFLYWSLVGVSWTLHALVEARESERRADRLMLEKSQLEASLRTTELEALRMRLDPHFLFNSLQNISVLVQNDPHTGSRMLTRLGDLLRVSLRRDRKSETTLRAELELTKSYLAIEQMRFGDRLSSLVAVEPGSEEALVPSLLLQPLVENAIRHGLNGVRERGTIVIRSRLEEESLVLTVTDNGAGPQCEPLAEGRVGIGLGATCERLERMYPGEHTFSIHAAPEGGTEVLIRLPLRFEPVREASRGAHVATAHR